MLVEDVSGEAAPEWVKGPPVALREKAAAGFAKRYGVTAEELEERDGFLGVEVPGKPLAERLAAILDALAFSKSMQWEAGGLRFARPVRWLCARLGEAVVLGDGTSYGHRFTSGRIEIPSAESYAETLRAHGVEPDAAERRRQIVAGLPDGWRDPLGKLHEVVHLVESPVVLEGGFDERFLALPARVIETAMQAHQRYFPLEGARFAFVANGGDPALVIRGNERVLEGRLDDATFTFERDLAVGIEQLLAGLGSITFFQGAGSFADKTERLVRLVARLGAGDATREAARLSKADQASELVREFPDLEGHIGAEYARAAGYPEAVCAAIDEHYLPDGADAPLPSTEAGRVLSAADKIDNLTVAFELGHKPSGSRDPYGLRRAAIGLCRLAIEGGLTLELEGEVKEFVEERLEGLLDVPVELVRAARASALQDLGGIAALAEALNGLEADAARADRHRLQALRPHRARRRARRRRPGALPGGRRARGVRRARARPRADRSGRPARLRDLFRRRRRARGAAGALLRGRARDGRRRGGAPEQAEAPARRARHARAARRPLAASRLVPLQVMPSSFWVASTKRCKDAGSADSGTYRRDRGRRSAPRDRGPEADMYCLEGH